MSQEKIKMECDSLYKTINDVQERLKVVQSFCNHPNTFEGKYAWRIGVAMDAAICEDCGALVKIIDQQTNGR